MMMKRKRRFDVLIAVLNIEAKYLLEIEILVMLS